MSLNCNEIDKILEELDLTDALIQDIVQPSYDSLALYTYKSVQAKIIIICLAAGACRINETKKRVPKNDKPLRFNELLRSRIKGSRIISCRQIDKERIVEIKLERAGKIYVLPAATEKLKKIADKKADVSSQDVQSQTSERYTLYIRLWSNASNIFLCDNENLIIDSFFRRPAKNEITGKVFELPYAKTDSDSSQKKVWTVRAFDEIEKINEKKNPGASPLSFNEKVDIWYSEHASSVSLESLQDQASKWYESHRSKQQAALDMLKEKKSYFQNASQWKHQGDLVLSFGYKIDGTSNFLECVDYETEKQVRIKIDPKKNAQENASIFYDTYKKETGALAGIEHDIALAEKALLELNSLYESMKKEKNPLKLEQMLRRDSKPKQQEKKMHPGLEYEINGWTLYVGRDANENDELLRHYVKGLDMWYHTRDYAGGYVFVKARAGKTIPLDIMLYAGNLAVYYSKARKNGTADLYYTHVKYLRRAKNGPKGLVLPTNEKNLRIALDDEKMRILDEYAVE